MQTNVTLPLGGSSEARGEPAILCSFSVAQPSPNPNCCLFSTSQREDEFNSTLALQGLISCRAKKNTSLFRRDVSPYGLLTAELEDYVGKSLTCKKTLAPGRRVFLTQALQWGTD